MFSHLVSQTHGRFDNPRFTNYNFSAQNITETFGEDVGLPADDARKPQFSAFNFTPYLTKFSQDKKGLFKEERSWISLL